MPNRFSSAAVLVAASLLSAAPALAADVSIDKAWVRLPAVPGRPGAAYFMATGNAASSAIVGISSPDAKRAEMHQTVKSDGAMRMTPLDRVDVARGQMVMFEPGGRHVMLFGLDPKIRPGRSVRLDVKLANGTTISTKAKAMAPGAMPTADMDMGHKHK